MRYFFSMNGKRDVKVSGFRFQVSGTCCLFVEKLVIGICLGFGIWILEFPPAWAAAPLPQPPITWTLTGSIANVKLEYS
ncbi:MAG: hypothetical protein AAB853_01030, partial [Patescibacteria group bacterium]